MILIYMFFLQHCVLFVPYVALLLVCGRDSPGLNLASACGSLSADVVSVVLEQRVLAGVCKIV